MKVHCGKHEKRFVCVLPHGVFTRVLGISRSDTSCVQGLLEIRDTHRPRTLR